MSEQPSGTMTDVLLALADISRLVTSGFADTRAELADLRRDINDLQGLRGEVQSLREEVNTLREEVHTLREEVHTLRQDVTGFRVDIMARLDRVNDNIAMIRDDITVNMARADRRWALAAVEAARDANGGVRGQVERLWVRPRLRN